MRRLTAMFEVICIIMNFLIPCIFLFLFYIVITYYDTTYKFKKQAIEHGYAEYDNKTGEWKWKNSQTLNTEP